MEFLVLLTSVSDVKAFVDAASLYPYEVDVKAGRYVINGKSIMGLFSVDLSGPVTVVLTQDGEEAKKLKERLKSYIQDVIS